MKYLLWIWQLPQNIIGFIFARFLSKESSTAYTYKNRYVKVFYSSHVMGTGVCFGEYIILDYNKYYNRMASYVIQTISHEAGHRRQSRMLGPLYLLVIGLPSAIGNIIQRLFHKPSSWYYKQPWEAWADKLGGVHR